jgi:hypothetical protein
MNYHANDCTLFKTAFEGGTDEGFNPSPPHVFSGMKVNAFDRIYL